MKKRWLIILFLIYSISYAQKKVDYDSLKTYISQSWNKTIRYNPNDSSSLIGLPKPYTVPCIESNFQEMYYWDTYFTNVGLILDGRIDLAINNTVNLLYMVEKFGKVYNGNRDYYSNRSQPPYLSMMVYDIFRVNNDTVWLKRVYPSLIKEYDFWMSKRLTPTGLNHYSHNGDDKLKLELAKYATERIGNTSVLNGLTKNEILKIGSNFIAECESGWDFNPRFQMHCEEFCPIDLNSNLYIYEKNFEFFSRIMKNKEQELQWRNIALKREKLMDKYFYNSHDGFYYDYNFVSKKQSDVKSGAVFSLLFAKSISDSKAKRLIKLALNKLEYTYGLATCENKNYRYKYQWSYPNGWAPIHYLAIAGLDNYGYKEDAIRITNKYVTNVVKTFIATNNLWEKYNVVEGNVNVSNEYSMPPMIGWTAGVFLYATNYRIKNQIRKEIK